MVECLEIALKSRFYQNLTVYNFRVKMFGYERVALEPTLSAYTTIEGRWELRSCYLKDLVDLWAALSNFYVKIFDMVLYFIRNLSFFF